MPLVCLYFSDVDGTASSQTHRQRHQRLRDLLAIGVLLKPLLQFLQSTASVRDGILSCPVHFGVPMRAVVLGTWPLGNTLRD